MSALSWAECASPRAPWCALQVGSGGALVNLLNRYFSEAEYRAALELASRGGEEVGAPDERRA